MKKVVAFMGSPRKGKNTDIVVDKLIEGMNSPEITVEKINLVDCVFRGCKGCFGCSKNGECILEDDMRKIYPKIESADGFIFASPTHNYNITSDMKILIDRLYCYFDWNATGFTVRLPANKQAIIVALCGGPDENFMGFTLDAMSRPIQDFGINIFKELPYYNTVKHPVRRNQAFLDELYELGKAFGNALLGTD